MGGRLLAFVGVSVLLALAPGPDFALVTRNALAHGRRGVLLTTAGLTSALILWVVATAVGVAALLATSARLYTALKLVGAVYLGYLGIRAILASLHDHPGLTGGVAAGPARALPIWRQGFLSALFNPKLGVFFVTFLPQFVDPGRAALPQLLGLGAIFTAVGIGWMNVYGFSISRLRAVVTNARVRRWMERATGLVLLAFGARLAVDRG